MLRRKIYDKLLAWKNNKGKKDAILLRGVRQCGKTYIVREFGKREYKNFIEINFIERPDMQAVFPEILMLITWFSKLNLVCRVVNLFPVKRFCFWMKFRMFLTLELP